MHASSDLDWSSQFVNSIHTQILMYVQKYMHDEAALNLMETDLYSKPRRCFSGTQGLFVL